jgi:hypothetical protein
MKTYIQPETEITFVELQTILAGSLDPTQYTDPNDDYQGARTALFFDEEEENYENIPLFEVRHKSVWE